MVIINWYSLSFRTPEYVHLCLCYITMNIESIVSTVQACIVYCVKSKWYITRDLLLYMYIHMDVLNADGCYGHYIFYRLLPIDLHEFNEFKCTFAFYDFYHIPLQEMCCMHHHIVSCVEYYTCFVRDDQIKMFNQSSIILTLSVQFLVKCVWKI